ncbi:MAG TPA: ABC transporter permease [Acidimicrobiales bacterium]|nr:ABC transporter permease [Acidimicrobiales bacterium]
MPEPFDSDVAERTEQDLLGLTDLGRADAPELVGAQLGGTVAAELAADPTLRQAVSPALSGRKWYRGLGWGFWVAVGYVVAWILLAIFANLLPLDSPTQLYPDCFANAAPSSAHLLGCDPSGFDVFSRLIFGARVSLIVGFASIALSQIVGGTLGIVAGYFRGWFDDLMAVVSNVFLSFPSLVLGLLIVSYVGRSLFDIVMIIAIVAWPLLYRVVRSATIEYSQREYVLAAQALGCKRSRILWRILLPDVVPAAITYGLVGVALAIVGEGALSFLGQSVRAPTPTWGNMIALGSDTMPTYTSLLFAPAIAMFTFILAINFIGDRLRSLLDVREAVL